MFIKLKYFKKWHSFVAVRINKCYLSKKWEGVRDELVASRVNAGYPYIVVENGDCMKNGELYFAHRFEGQDLDIMYLEKVLMPIHRLWGRTLHIETNIEEKKTFFSCDGCKVHRKRLDCEDR
jgi:stage V sporulation protein R